MRISLNLEWDCCFKALFISSGASHFLIRSTCSDLTLAFIYRLLRLFFQRLSSIYLIWLPMLLHLFCLESPVYDADVGVRTLPWILTCVLCVQHVGCQISSCLCVKRFKKWVFRICRAVFWFTGFILLGLLQLGRPCDRFYPQQSACSNYSPLFCPPSVCLHSIALPAHVWLRHLASTHLNLCHLLITPLDLCHRTFAQLWSNLPIARRLNLLGF